VVTYPFFCSVSVYLKEGKELTYAISTQIITSLTTNEEEREAIKARVRKKESKA